ncbi:MAG: toprim domain-containing protein, partial [Thermodesulfobacteriota bacterium]
EEENQPKYLNSPETPIFSKGRLLYGLDKSRHALKGNRTILIVEGYFDLLALWAHGVRNVAATLGTALTSQHLRLLKGYIREAVLVFDADEAGRTAAARTLPLFISADLEARVLSLPDGHDPDTFVRAHGPEAVEAAVEQAGGLLDFYLERTIARHPDTLAGKSKAAQEVLEVIAQVEGAARADLLRQRLAERLGISEEALRLSQRRRAPVERQEAGLVKESPADFEAEVLRTILLHHRAAAVLLRAGLGPDFRDQGLRAAYLALAGQFDSTGRVDLDRLEGLEPGVMDLLSGLALAEDGLDEGDVESVAADYLAVFAGRDRRRRALDLSRLIKEAQEKGDDGGLAVLLEEKARLLKENIG